MEPEFLGFGRGGEFRSMTHCGVGRVSPDELSRAMITRYMDIRMETKNSSTGCSSGTRHAKLRRLAALRCQLPRIIFSLNMNEYSNTPFDCFMLFI